MRGGSGGTAVKLVDNRAGDASRSWRGTTNSAFTAVGFCFMAAGSATSPALPPHQPTRTRSARIRKRSVFQPAHLDVPGCNGIFDWVDLGKRVPTLAGQILWLRGGPVRPQSHPQPDAGAMNDVHYPTSSAGRLRAAWRRNSSFPLTAATQRTARQSLAAHARASVQSTSQLTIL